MQEERHPEPKNVSRRQARRDAMVVLYQKDLTASALDELYGNLEKDKGYQVAEYTRSLVEGVLALSEELDRAIDANSKGWSSSRMGALERNILRIAVFEIMKRADIAFETSVDEAVTLAKRYCSKEAGSLVNGILGNMKKETGTGG